VKHKLMLVQVEAQQKRRGGRDEVMTGSRALLLMSLGLGAAMSAHAAGPYTLTCDAARSGTVTIALTGYTVAVTGTSEAAIGAGKGASRRENQIRSHRASEFWQGLRDAAFDFAGRRDPAKLQAD